MNIPKQLQRKEFGFVLLGKWNVWINPKTKEKKIFPKEDYEKLDKEKIWKPLGKAPFEYQWEKKPYKFDDPKLLKHLENGENYGVIGGYGNLRILDIDDKKEVEKYKQEFQETFMVETGSGGLHIYFISEYETNHVLKDGLGELRAMNYQCVGGNCLHPNGNAYKSLNDNKILTFPKEFVEVFLKPHLKDKIVTTGDPTQKVGEGKDIDKSRSGREWKKVLGLIRRNKTKEEIFEEMKLYAKWGTSTPQYKELTYKKAKDWCEFNPTKKELLEVEKEQAIEIGDVFGKRKQAQIFIEEYPLYYDVNKIWWVWNKEKYSWERSNETDILNRIAKLYPQIEVVNSKEKNEILESLRQMGRLNKPKESIESWVQFKDKIYDLETGEEFVASSKYFVTNPIDLKLGKSEDTPNLDKLFMAWVGDKQELYELLSFCIVPKYFIHRIFCLIGSGSNGKSTFLKILTKFVGQENVTSSSLNLIIKERFEGSKLLNKLVCLMGETNFNLISNTSFLKNLTGEDLVRCEFKGKDVFDFENYAKLVMATNSLPPTADKTEGYYRRWKIVEFNNKFTKEKNVIKEIKKSEYENLALKCFNIAKVLWKERVFTNDTNFEGRKKAYEEKSNPLNKFIKENFVKDINSEVLFTEFYEELTTFLDERGFRNLSVIAVSKQLKNEGFEVKNLSKKNRSGKFILGLQRDNDSNDSNDPLSYSNPHVESNEKKGNMGNMSHFEDKIEVVKIK